MYLWRSMTDAEREAALARRRTLRYPWHGPPTLMPVEAAFYHLTAACYEHAHVLGCSPERLTAFEACLLHELEGKRIRIQAWSFLPNHYHLLVGVSDARVVKAVLGQQHGRTSRAWNQEEGSQGRKVWHRTADRRMRGEGHYWATMNYIHNNAVKHGYAQRWQDWPWSSASEFLERAGREQVERIWHAYPVFEYGKGWDD
ncbi:MAG: transposase [Planctomycetes bacterium]|nr:transposase [Planctomycetota bacterium]